MKVSFVVEFSYIGARYQYEDESTEKPETSDKILV